MHRKCFLGQQKEKETEGIEDFMFGSHTAKRGEEQLDVTVPDGQATQEKCF